MKLPKKFIVKTENEKQRLIVVDKMMKEFGLPLFDGKLRGNKFVYITFDNKKIYDCMENYSTLTSPPIPFITFEEYLYSEAEIDFWALL